MYLRLLLSMDLIIGRVVPMYTRRAGTVSFIYIIYTHTPKLGSEIVLFNRERERRE